MQFSRITFLKSILMILVVNMGLVLGGQASYAASLYSVAPGSTSTVNEWGTTKLVTNNCGLSVMVPTNTSAEYSLFLNNKPACVSLADPVIYTYAWITGNYGSCSATCGGGSQNRSVACQRNDGQIVADAYCTNPKPIVSQACNTQGCATPVNGACGPAAGTCSAGTVTYDNGQTSCNGTRVWTCGGSAGGSDISCSSANSECPCILASDGAVIPSGSAYAEWGSSYICDAGVKTPTGACSGTIEQYGWVGLINHPGGNTIWCPTPLIQ